MLRQLSFFARASFIVALTGSTLLSPARAQKPPDGMVLVPAGTFTMGTNHGERTGPNVPRENNDARPEHQVDVAAFYIDKTEVTNAQYKKFCDATKLPYPPIWLNSSYPQGEDDFPVTHINWYEASAYAAWANKRLPTEAQWEKAARGTDKRTFPWGEKWDLSKVVWNQSRPSKVGSKPEGASPYGALDMAGNVFEWTSSWYDAYPNAPIKFAEFGKTFKIVRGGGFDGYNSIAHTYYRSITYPRSRTEWVGFRCVKPVDVSH